MRYAERMPASPAIRSDLSESDYLAMERRSDVKHEYFRGELFAMAGASREHNLIVLNLGSELRRVLRDRPCEVYPSDMRVQVTASGLYTYPDVTVVCDPPRFTDDARDTLLNPSALFEVLSDTTEAYDRGGKFEQYRRLDSLQSYVLLSQHRPLVEAFHKQAGGGWVLHEHNAGGTLHLASLNATLAIDEIYLKVFSNTATNSSA